MPRSSPQKCLQNIDVVVLAGGLGSRLRSVVADVPKVLAPIGGRPFISYLMDELRAFGARRIVMSLGHMADQVVAYLEGAKSEELEVVTSIETERRGTGGALCLTLPYLRSNPVMVMNGDSLTRVDLCRFVEVHRRGGAGISMVCTRIDNVARFGVVQLDGKDRVTAFLEKGRADGEGFINAGIYLFERAELEKIAMRGVKSLEHDVLEAAPPGTLQAYAGEFPFIDIGTEESYAKAKVAFRDAGPSGFLPDD